MGSIRLAKAASRLIAQSTERDKYRETPLVTWNPNKRCVNKKALHRFQQAATCLIFITVQILDVLSTKALGYLHTSDTKGLTREPILLIAVQNPIPKALVCVGKT